MGLNRVGIRDRCNERVEKDRSRFFCSFVSFHFSAREQRVSRSSSPFFIFLQDTLVADRKVLGNNTSCCDRIAFVWFVSRVREGESSSRIKPVARTVKLLQLISVLRVERC